MEEYNNSFYFIDGNNLSLSELKYRLSKMGLLDHSENNKDFKFYAKSYNNALMSEEFPYFEKIKFILDKDAEKEYFSEFLNKKRIRSFNSEKKEINCDFFQNRNKVDYSNNYKNG